MERVERIVGYRTDDVDFTPLRLDKNALLQLRVTGCPPAPPLSALRAQTRAHQDVEGCTASFDRLRDVLCECNQTRDCSWIGEPIECLRNVGALVVTERRLGDALEEGEGRRHVLLGDNPLEVERRWRCHAVDDARVEPGVPFISRPTLTAGRVEQSSLGRGPAAGEGPIPRPQYWMSRA
jgi:hypothetical protein